MGTEEHGAHVMACVRGHSTTGGHFYPSLLIPDWTNAPSASSLVLHQIIFVSFPQAGTAGGAEDQEEDKALPLSQNGTTTRISRSVLSKQTERGREARGWGGDRWGPGTPGAFSA